MFVCVCLYESVCVFCVYVCVVSLFAVKRNSKLIHLQSVVRRYQTVKNKERKKNILISLNYSLCHQYFSFCVC